MFENYKTMLFCLNSLVGFGRYRTSTSTCVFLSVECRNVIEFIYIVKLLTEYRKFKWLRIRPNSFYLKQYKICKTLILELCAFRISDLIRLNRFNLNLTSIGEICLFDSVERKYPSRSAFFFLSFFCSLSPSLVLIFFHLFYAFRRT